MRGISELSDSDMGPYQASNSNCADLADMPLSLTPVALVHAALLFEHTGLGRCLEMPCSWLRLEVSCPSCCRSWRYRRVTLQKRKGSRQQIRSIPVHRREYAEVLSSLTEGDGECQLPRFM